jgi:ubiquinone/menaquinone biosynthesis C-methylase UbiE
VDEQHLQRARSFGDVAEAYQQARPTYPKHAVQWLLEAAPGRDVLDLAAGTGKLTRVIAEQGCSVTAVEPLGEMRAQLEHAHPEVKALAGSAEQIPLEDDSVDAVLVGQAFHWFDSERALPEIDRVLRPWGVLGLLWNIRDDSIGWVAELSSSLAVGHDVLSQVDGSYWAPVEQHPRFGQVERRDVPNPTPFDAARLVTWAASTSHFATMPPAERESTLQRVHEFALRHPGLGDDDHFTMPFVTVTVRARAHR